MAISQILEGTWEEIKRHEAALAGHRLRVLVMSGGEASQQPISVAEEQDLLDALAADASTPVLPTEANSRRWIYRDHD